MRGQSLPCLLGCVCRERGRWEVLWYYARWCYRTRRTDATGHTKASSFPRPPLLSYRILLHPPPPYLFLSSYQAPAARPVSTCVGGRPLHTASHRLGWRGKQPVTAAPPPPAPVSARPTWLARPRPRSGDRGRMNRPPTHPPPRSPPHFARQPRPGPRPWPSLPPARRAPAPPPPGSPRRPQGRLLCQGAAARSVTASSKGALASASGRSTLVGGLVGDLNERRRPVVRPPFRRRYFRRCRRQLPRRRRLCIDGGGAADAADVATLSLRPTPPRPPTHTPSRARQPHLPTRPAGQRRKHPRGVVVMSGGSTPPPPAPLPQQERRVIPGVFYSQDRTADFQCPRAMGTGAA